MKRSILKKLVSMMAVIVMVSLVACAKDEQAEVSTVDDLPSSTSTGIDIRGEEFTIWSPIYWVGKVAGFEDNVAWQQLQENLGITLNFEHPPVGQEFEQFNLMVAGDTLSDIISTGWAGEGLYKGGGDQYIDDEVLLRLNELIDQYAPDYKNAIETLVVENEQRDFYTDEGNMYAFFAISPYEEWCHNGIMYRQDWMDELGLENPETFAEIENVLTRFKEEKGAKYPFILPDIGVDPHSGLFLSSWDIGVGYYQNEGKVMYGPVQPEFKEYLALMNDWYEKGLIDKDFATRDVEAQKRMLTTGESGAIMDSPDTMGAWMQGITTMMGGKYPVEESGKRIQTRLKNYQKRPPFGFSITTACENPGAATAFLNYGYTEEGYMLMNYGIEGDTYNLTSNELEFNGNVFPAIEYTDTMMNNPDYSVLDAITKYKMHIGPFIRFEHEGNPAMNLTSAETRQFWTDEADTTLNLPMTTLTAEEGEEFARIVNQVETYQETAILQFIMGTRDLGTFDEYLADMEELGIARAIELQQTALDRYNNR